MKSLTILVDLDGIVADLWTPWLHDYNEDYDDNKVIEDFTSWETSDHIKKECGLKINNYLNADMFRSLQPLPGAVDGVNAIHDDGHQILFLTAAPEGTADAKVFWVRKVFPWAKKKDVACMHRKYLVRGDVLIDDSPHNIKSYRQWNPNSTILTISYPYNQDAMKDGAIVAGHYSNTIQAWDYIVKYIKEISND